MVPAHDIRSQNMDTFLGQFWHIVNPALMVGVYFLIFGVLLDARRGVDNYLGFLVIGVVLFQLTQRIVQDASMTISRNEGLLRLSRSRPLSETPAKSWAGSDTSTRHFSGRKITRSSPPMRHPKLRRSCWGSTTSSPGGRGVPISRSRFFGR